MPDNKNSRLERFNTRGDPQPVLTEKVPSCRRRAALKRPKDALAAIREERECEYCHEMYLPNAPGQKYCDSECQRKKHLKYPDGRFINCECCGKRLRADGMQQIVCKDKCEPKEGFIRLCVCCGEPGGYDDYYDYRGSVSEEGKFLTTCKQCIQKRNLRGYHRRKVQK